MAIQRGEERPVVRRFSPNFRPFNHDGLLMASFHLIRVVLPR